jgi:hypothetical protein
MRGAPIWRECPACEEAFCVGVLPRQKTNHGRIRFCPFCGTDIGDQAGVPSAILDPLHIS